MSSLLLHARCWGLRADTAFGQDFPEEWRFSLSILPMREFKCQSSCRWLALLALRMSAIIGPEAVQRELLSIVSILLKA